MDGLCFFGLLTILVTAYISGVGYIISKILSRLESIEKRLDVEEIRHE
jgi:hypothetical protein